jgi:transcription-repair coupling factor (superfamily II helicase)
MSVGSRLPASWPHSRQVPVTAYRQPGVIIPVWASGVRRKPDATVSAWPGERLRLEAYTQIAAIDSEAGVTGIRDELLDRYGELPEPVLNLLEVARLRTEARRAGLTDITAAGSHIRFAPVELPDSRQVRVQRLYPKTVLKPTVRTMLIPVPKTAVIGGQPLRDTELLAWCGEVIRSVLADLPVGVL